LHYRGIRTSNDETIQQDAEIKYIKVNTRKNIEITLTDKGYEDVNSTSAVSRQNPMARFMMSEMNHNVALKHPVALVQILV
jgi:hypothetical protein